MLPVVWEERERRKNSHRKVKEQHRGYQGTPCGQD